MRGRAERGTAWRARLPFRVAGGVVALLASLIGCARPAWDPGTLAPRRLAPQATTDLGPLTAVHPYLLPTAQTATLFLCRWQTELPIPVSLPRALEPELRRPLEAALRAWEQAGLGVHFVETSPAEASLRIELVDGPVATAAGPGTGNTVADCWIAVEPLESAAGLDPLPAELHFASVRLARNTPEDVRGLVRPLSPEELAGAALHELGHALGFQGHLARGESAMRREPEGLRRLGRRILQGKRFHDPALAALYALPSGVVLARTPVERWRTQLVDRMARVAEQNELFGPFARVGDAAARIFWRDARGREYGLQVINLAEVRHDPARLVVVPEPRVRRALPRSRDLSP